MWDVSCALVDWFIQSGRTDYGAAELARHAGISQRLFERHFPYKQDVIRHYLTAGMNRVVADVAHRPPEEPIRQALVSAWSDSWVSTDINRARALFRLVDQDRALRAIWLQVVLDSERQWARVIAPRIGVDPRSPQAAFIGAVVVAAYRLSTRPFSESSPPIDPAQMFAETLDLLGADIFARRTG